MVPRALLQLYTHRRSDDTLYRSVQAAYTRWRQRAYTRVTWRGCRTLPDSDSDHVSSVNPWRCANFVGAGTMLRLLLPYSLLALPQMHVFFLKGRKKRLHPSPRLFRSSAIHASG